MSAEVSASWEAWTRLQRRASNDRLSLADIFSIGNEARKLTGDIAPSQRIAVLGSLTMEYVSRAVACAMVQEGVLPVMYEAPHGTYVQEILNPESGLHRFRPDVVLVAPDWREFVEPHPIIWDAELVGEALKSRVSFFEGLWSVLEKSGCKVLQHTLVPPVHHYRGPAERRSPASPENQIRELNELFIHAARGRVQWIEMDNFAAGVGHREWCNERLFYSAQLGFDLKFLNDYMPWFRGAWRAASARSKKALVLDLDNTLWGGVIGDDGLEGIALGPSHGASGEAFRAWQIYLKQLSARGVILAVCSKNDPEIATAAFDHPASVLKREDFVAFECSWNDKALGLRNVAARLNIGLDSIVFADDNPAEVELVRQELPQVSAIHLGSDPSSFISRIELGQWFYTPEYTNEDAVRTGAYQVRRLAAEERQTVTNMEEYLRSLQMVGSLRPATEADIPRLAQLEAKTNQFNLTTRRYGDDALRQYRSRDDVFLLAFRLRDKFGEHGLVSSLIAIAEGEAVCIDSWLMSCRIFGRTAEQLILRALAQLALERGFKHLLGEYRPTEKNGVVADLYPRLGFEEVSGHGWCRSLLRPLDDLQTCITVES